jgi:glycosyltransferase involved in cell wall biosynthesis
MNSFSTGCPKKPPFKIVHFTFSVGCGNGIAIMDQLWFDHLDRNLFEPKVVYVDLEPNGSQPSSSIPLGRTTLLEGLPGVIKHIEDADIVQFNGSFDPFICEAARIKRLPVVEIMHQHEPGGMWPNVDALVCVSERVRNIQFRKEITKVIHNGIDLQKFSYGSNKNKSDRIVVLQPSQRTKKVHFHIDEIADEARAENPNVEFWLAGSGQVGQDRKGVKFLGLQKEMAPLYQQSDVMVLMAKNDGFGLVAAEAMACGCLPIVSSDGGSVEIVEHGCNGWIVPDGDRKTFRKILREALALRGTTKWFKMQRYARQTVRTKFSAASCISKYQQLYLQLLLNHQAPQCDQNKKNLSEVDLATSALLAARKFPLEKIVDSLHKLVSSGSILAFGASAHPNWVMCREIGISLAKLAYVEGFLDLSDELFSFFYTSGARGSWLTYWIERIPGTKFGLELGKYLLIQSNYDNKVALILAEIFLKSGDVSTSDYFVALANRSIGDASK